MTTDIQALEPNAPESPCSEQDPVPAPEPLAASAEPLRPCAVCGRTFAVRFRYQMEERTTLAEDGTARSGFLFFCSQGCLERSHAGEDGLTDCTACGTRFRVELVRHVLMAGGRRQYACGPACRDQLLAESRGARLGDFLAAAATTEAAPTSAPAAQRQAPHSAASGALDGHSAGPLAAVVSADAARTAEEASPSNADSAAASGVRTQGTSAAGSSLLAPELLGRARAMTGVDLAGAASRRKQEPPAIPAAPSRLAVFNHKGGTGKTTTSVTVAAGLAARGYRVLLVDTDSQGNVAVSLGMKVERSLYHVLVMGLPVASAVQNVRPNLDVLPSNETLAAAELYLAGRTKRDQILAQRLATAAAAYDFILIDCSPSLSLMNQNALVAAEAILCPVACDYLSLVGVRQVLRTLKHVGTALQHRLDFWGVLPTMYDARARICQDSLGTLREHFGERCLPPIRLATKVKEAPAHGKTLMEHAPDSLATSDYALVLDRLTAHRQPPCQAESA